MERRGFRSDRAFGVADMVPDLGVFGTGVVSGRQEKRRIRDGFRDLWMSREKLLVAWTRVIIVVVVKF